MFGIELDIHSIDWAWEMTAGQIRGFKLHPQPDLGQQWKCLHFAKLVTLCVSVWCVRERLHFWENIIMFNSCQNGSSPRFLGSWAHSCWSLFCLWYIITLLSVLYVALTTLVFFQFPPVSLPALWLCMDMSLFFFLIMWERGMLS